MFPSLLEFWLDYLSCLLTSNPLFVQYICGHDMKVLILLKRPLFPVGATNVVISNPAQARCTKYNIM